MKKKFLIIGSITLLIIVIVSLILIFNKKDANIEDIYLKVFDGESFILDNKKTNIKKFTEKYGELSYYAFVDYGSDSKQEMFIKLSDDTNYIFNYENKKMYLIKLDETIISNTEDGYSSFYGDAIGWLKYDVKKDKVTSEVILSSNVSENKCYSKSEEVDCKDYIKKEIEFLNTISKMAESKRIEDSKYFKEVLV